MAEGDITFYNSFKSALLNGTAPDLDSDTIKVALLENHTPDIDAHEFWDDVSADEVSGTGYTAGGVTLGGATVTADTTDDEGVFDANNASWAGLNVGVDISHAIIYEDTGTPGTSRLIANVEISTPSNGGDYAIAWNAEGIININ